MTRIYQVEEMTGIRMFQSTSNGMQVDVKAAPIGIHPQEHQGWCDVLRK